MLLRIMVLGLLVAGQDERVNPPSEEAQANALKQIRDIFKDDYAVKTTSAQKKLGALLLKQGRDTKDDAALQYILFREAAELAGRYGDLDTLLGSLRSEEHTSELQSL